MDSKIKGVLCIIGAICMHLMIGNVFTIANISTYIASYLRYRQRKSGLVVTTTSFDTYFLSNIQLAMQNFFMIISGFIEPIIGVRFTVLGSAILLMSAYSILYYIPDFRFVLLCSILCGLASSLSYFSVISNAWKYFPEKKGAITGLILGFCGMSPCIFTTIADRIINPNKEKATEIYEKEKYYGDSVSSNVQSFFFFLMVTAYILSAISFFFSFPYKEEENAKDNQETEKIIQNQENTNPLINQLNDEHNNMPVKNKDSIQDWKKALKSKEYLMFLLFVFCGQFFVFGMSMLYRGFGTLNGLDENILRYLSLVYSLSNCALRLLWGALFDKFGYLFPFITISVTVTGVSAVFYFCRKNSILYFIINMIADIPAAGFMALTGPFVGKKFGQKNSQILFGIMEIAAAFSAILPPVILNTMINGITDYLYFFILEAILGVIAIIICFLINDKEFKYEENDINAIKGKLIDEQPKTEIEIGNVK